MNWENIEGNWKELKGKIRSQWGKLTDEDLETIAGKKDALLGRLQQRYGYHKEQAERELDAFIKNVPVAVKHAKDAVKDAARKTTHH